MNLVECSKLKWGFGLKWFAREFVSWPGVLIHHKVFNLVHEILCLEVE